MSNTVWPRYCRFRFSLRTLLLVSTLVGIGSVVWRQLVREPGPVLCGQVWDQTGRPISRVKVEVWTGGPSWWKVYETFTDSQGRYALAPVHGARIWDQNDLAHHMFRISLAHPSYEPVDMHSVYVEVPDIDGQMVRQDLRMASRRGDAESDDSLRR